MRRFGSIAVVLLFSLLAAAPAARAERFALLIGNQAYNDKVGPLKNPHNDIALIGAALRSLKFKVTEVKDADYKAIDISINRHIQAVRREGEGSISLIYYAGHGAANPDTRINYLIPVDVANADDEDLWTHSINLNRIVEALREQAPAATHYVVFDACRNELNLTRKGKRALADRGFAPIAYTPGVMIAYATAPGKTATDAGTYARALAVEIVKPGVEAVTMFRRVALQVHREIGQDPWMAASTLPEHYIAGTKSEEQILWESVKSSNDPAVLGTYLARYPNGDYAGLVRALIEQHEQQLKAEQAAQEQERKREEVARRAAEVQKLEEGLRAREAALAERQRLMDQGKKANVDQQPADEAAQATELAKAREEARLAREAAKAAEEQRLAAAKAAEDAKMAAEVSKEKVAALHQPDKSSAMARQFDGSWTVRQTSNGNCLKATATWGLRIDSGVVSARMDGVMRRGTARNDGSFRLVSQDSQGRPLILSGILSGGAGRGTYHVEGTTCAGTFALSRN